MVRAAGTTTYINCAAISRAVYSPTGDEGKPALDVWTRAVGSAREEIADRLTGAECEEVRATLEGGCPKKF